MIDVYIEVDGGNVQAVYANDKNVNIELIDWDNAEVDEGINKSNKEAIDMINKGNYYRVW